MVTITHDPQARRRSYELLAEEFGLRPSAAVGSPPWPASESPASP